MGDDWIVEFFTPVRYNSPLRIWVLIPGSPKSFLQAAMDAKERSATWGFTYRIRNKLTGHTLPAAIL